MRWFRKGLPVFLFYFSLCISEGAPEVPSEIFLRLASANFRQREIAETDLFNWVKAQPRSRLKEVILQSEMSEDPEIRLRCLSVIRALAMEDYRNEGEGYLGIMMREEWVGEPAGPPRYGVRVTSVVPKGAAERGNLAVRDLIVEIEGQGWTEPGAADRFTHQIRRTKPGTPVTLKIIRNKEPLILKLMLDRRPPIQPNPMGRGPFDLETQDRLAKDAYFKKWLDRHQKQK
jgi:hypothetical protein